MLCPVSRRDGWASSDRASRLPADWQARRRAVAARAGGRCQAIMSDGSRCRWPGTECDHIARGDNHDLSNLQWLCHWHHAQKTRREAVQARRDKQAAAERRRMESHPGWAP